MSAPAQNPPLAGAGRNGPAICTLLALSVLVVFAGTLRHNFINYDDDQYVYENPMVVKGLTASGIAWAFTHSHSANWHPLTWISHMLDCEFCGLRPGGHHLTSVVLHALNGVLLFLLLKRLTGAQWRSAFVAALFALHPLHVESVAWVSERKDVLSACFGFLALLRYERYARAAGNRVAWTGSRDYWLALLFFALGLMSKPMLVTLPFAMLLLDYWPLQRFVRAPAVAGNPTTLRVGLRLIGEKVPFLVLSVASSLATLVAQQGAVQPLARISPGVRSVNAIDSCVRYLGKTFWPVDLAIPYPHAGYGSLRLFCVSACLILAITWAAIHFRRKFPFLAMGWFWFLGMLVPVIGLVQVGMQSMADRYTYLPLIGVFVMLTWGAGEWVARWRLPMPAVWGLALTIIGACAARTLDQLRYWKDSGTLFNHTVAVTAANDLAHYNLGNFYFNDRQLADAIDHYRQALLIRPGYDNALHNLGVALAANGNLDEAAVTLREAIRLRPDRADACYNLANVFALQHKPDEAVPLYLAAIRLKPDYPEAHNNLANVLLLLGRKDEAAAHYREALRLKPDHAGAKRALNGLGLTP